MVKDASKLVQNILFTNKKDIIFSTMTYFGVGSFAERQLVRAIHQVIL
jgi:hypothetical protein